MKSKKTRTLTDKQRLEVASHALKIYANTDFWQYRGAYNKLKKKIHGSFLDPKYTSLEVVDSKDGLMKDGWEWAKEALEKIT